jgi:hypothetical protein
MNPYQTSTPRDMSAISYAFESFQDFPRVKLEGREGRSDVFIPFRQL